MAGPVTLALGPFVFESHGFGFTDLRRRTSTRWAEMQVAGGLNPSQWTGGDGQVETIRGVLFPHEFGGTATLEGLTQASIAGQVLPLVSLGGDVRNIFDMWFIEGIDDDHDFVDAFGRPMREAYRIDIKAYQGGGIGFSPLSILSFL